MPFTLFWEKQIWLVNACQNCYFKLPVTFRGEKPAIPALFPIIPLHPAHFSRNHNRSAWCAGNQRKDLRHNPDKAISTPVLWKYQSKFNQKLKTNLFYLSLTRWNVVNPWTICFDLVGRCVKCLIPVWNCWCKASLPESYSRDQNIFNRTWGYNARSQIRVSVCVVFRGY